MEAEKQKITNDVLAKLQGLDQLLSSGGSAALAPIDQNAAMQQAGSMFTKGQPAASAFQFTDLPGAQLQGTGAEPSQLPIFTLPAKKQTA